MRTLSLSYSALGGYGAGVLAEALRRNSVLTCIDLTDNGLGAGERHSPTALQQHTLTGWAQVKDTLPLRYNSTH